MSKRVDHSEAASKFIKAKDHVEFHDGRLWDLRGKRDRESTALPEWEELRTLASGIKEHTLTHLARYLEEFERNAIANGAKVHWARARALEDGVDDRVVLRGVARPVHLRAEPERVAFELF